MELDFPVDYTPAQSAGFVAQRVHEFERKCGPGTGEQAITEVVWGTFIEAAAGMLDVVEAYDALAEAWDQLKRTKDKPGEFDGKWLAVVRKWEQQERSLVAAVEQRRERERELDPALVEWVRKLEAQR